MLLGPMRICVIKINWYDKRKSVACKIERGGYDINLYSDEIRFGAPDGKETLEIRTDGRVYTLLSDLTYKSLHNLTYLVG